MLDGLENHSVPGSNPSPATLENTDLQAKRPRTQTEVFRTTRKTPQPTSRVALGAGRCALAPATVRPLLFRVWWEAFATPRTVIGEDLSEWGSSSLSSPNRVEAWCSQEFMILM
jgi:hypothetical protein